MYGHILNVYTIDVIDDHIIHIHILLLGQNILHHEIHMN